MPFRLFRPRGPPPDGATASRAAGATSERLGRRGERAAVRALRALGYRILARNVRTAAGEIDVIAVDGETIAVIEVKASASAGSASPARRVDYGKRARLRLAFRAVARGAAWAASPYRFDVVSVRFMDGKPSCVVHRGGFRLHP